MIEPAILVSNHPTKSGQEVIEVTLNAPKLLNALSSKMIEILLVKLPVWDADPGVSAIVVRGMGERAFCAGGDIQHLYQAMKKGEVEQGQAFFNSEYSLNLVMHSMQTPLLVWGHGYVMGGGMGLLQGASLRIATHSSRLAMPEISIGLFPDVGASFFLHKVPDELGLFLGLTGAIVNGTDARELNLVDALLADSDYLVVLEQLQNLPKQTKTEHLKSIRELIQGLESKDNNALPSDIMPHKGLIINALVAEDLSTVFSNLQGLKGLSKWLDKAIISMESGSPTSLHLTFCQLRQAPQDIAQALEQEYVLAVNIILKGEFQEGIRALLIDKDQQPKWRYSEVKDVPQAWLESFYQSDNITKPDFGI
ncbi:MAG TPA: enoyl-CoA hydratase/isomerase family protein [Gammaproteobacteria bacterium]|jgi:enoyl-CoA hydratase/carnithine racemase|nr:enoyl-CoA hydratase/isomerase family protein [Gammaproteobacteria bacterium]